MCSSRIKMKRFLQIPGRSSFRSPANEQHLGCSCGQVLIKALKQMGKQRQTEIS